MQSLKNYISLIRPHHWIKNSFIFLPVFFGGQFLHPQLWPSLIAGFLIFSIIASAVYILNDLQDIESDKKHPVKCKRPFASGKVSQKTGYLMLFLHVFIGLTSAWLLNPSFFYIITIYLIINIFYSYGLKSISILDIMIVAFGFILRLKAGGILADVNLSIWINIMVFLLALLIAVGKRRDDILIREQSGIILRKSLTGYNLPFLNAWLSILSAVTVVAYLMYTLSPIVIERLGTYRLYYTTVFVVAGLMRYLQLVYIDNATASPIKILYKDTFIQVIIVTWVMAFFTIIYLPDMPIFK